MQLKKMLRKKSGHIGGGHITLEILYFSVQYNLVQR